MKHVTDPDRVRLSASLGGLAIIILHDGAWGLRIPLGFGLAIGVFATERGVLFSLWRKVRLSQNEATGGE